MDTARNIRQIDDRPERRQRPDVAEPPRSPLTAERVEQLRNRIHERAYDNDSVLAVTAWKILGSRDL